MFASFRMGQLELFGAKTMGGKAMIKIPDLVTIAVGDDDFPSEEVLKDKAHCISAKVCPINKDINLTFCSRESFYDFARSVLREAMFETSGQMELYPLIVDGAPEVVDGCRLTEDSSRIFIFYPSGTPTAGNG